MNINKIALMIRLGLDGESLNNQGNIGNVVQPTQIELCDGTTRQAITGEMLKHLHTRNLRLLADENELCNTCKILSPMKNGNIKEKDPNLSESGNRTKNCIIDDIHGFMNAGKGKNEKRTSTIKCSYAIATEENEYQNILHSRVEVLSSQNKKSKKEKIAEKGDNSTINEGNTIKEQNTQMIYYRPIRSNIYALTIQIDLDRIGLDDEETIPAVDEKTRIMRQKKCLQALKNMFIDMEGALCSTSLPHIRNIEGVLVHKTDKNDVLVKYSALNDDFIEVNKKIGTNVTEFKNIEEFVEVIDNLI